MRNCLEARGSAFTYRQSQAIMLPLRLRSSSTLLIITRWLPA